MRSRYVFLAMVVVVLLVCRVGLSVDPNTQSTRTPQSVKDPQKEKAIRELLRVTKVSQMAIGVMKDYVSETLKRDQTLKPEQKNNFVRSLNSELKSKEIEDIYVPIYDKHYTLKEVRELTRFYRTRIGKKLVNVQPLIMKEAQRAGQLWGMKVMSRVNAKMVKEHSTSTSKGKPAKGKAGKKRK